jgi:hypothetical protein
MNLGKTSGWAGRGAPVENPPLILQAMQDLAQQEQEFQLKVEGAQTLPYSARVQHVDPRKSLLHLKLIRPLPHELALGATFEMLFAAGDQRFEAPCVFQGREGYLLYRFTIPVLMAPSDRRHAKRYPFRPREKAYVIAQDGGVPGHGLSGPLVNLSMGGLAFRVDRVMRLDDHLRVTPGLGFFERGKAFPMLKVRDLHNLPVFLARGILAYALEREGEIIVGVTFGELMEAEFQDLHGVLATRDLMQRASPVSASPTPREPGARSAAETKGPAARVAPAGSQTPDALRQLGRRCARLILVMAPGPGREQVQQALGAGGFLRLDTADTLDQALAALQADREVSCPLLVVETPSEGTVSLAGIRALQKGFGEARELPVALITREAPLALDPAEPLIRPLPWPSSEDLAWVPLLDDLAGLD